MGADRLLEVPVLAVTLLASSGAVVLCSRATGQRVAEGPMLRLPLASLQVVADVFLAAHAFWARDILGALWTSAWSVLSAVLVASCALAGYAAHVLRRSRLPPLTPPLSAPPPSLPPSPPPSPLPSPPASSPAPPQPLHLNGPKGSAGWSLPFRLVRRAPPPLPRDASPQTPSSTSSLSQESRESAFRQATSKEAASSALGTAATWAALALSPLNAEALYLLPWRRRSYFRLPTLAMCVCVSAVALLHSGGILVVSLQLLAAANAKADDLDDEGRLAAVYLAVYVSLLLAVAGLLLRVGRLCAISARALNLSAAVIRPAKLGRFAMRREQGSQKGGARPATAAEARARATAARQEEARLLEEAAAAASMYQVCDVRDELLAAANVARETAEREEAEAVRLEELEAEQAAAAASRRASVGGRVSLRDRRSSGVVASWTTTPQGDSLSAAVAAGPLACDGMLARAKVARDGMEEARARAAAARREESRLRAEAAAAAALLQMCDVRDELLAAANLAAEAAVGEDAEATRLEILVEEYEVCADAAAGGIKRSSVRDGVLQRTREARVAAAASRAAAGRAESTAVKLEEGATSAAPGERDAALARARAAREAAGRASVEAHRLEALAAAAEASTKANVSAAAGDASDHPESSRPRAADEARATAAARTRVEVALSGGGGGSAAAQAQRQIAAETSRNPHVREAAARRVEEARQRARSEQSSEARLSQRNSGLVSAIEAQRRWLTDRLAGRPEPAAPRRDVDLEATDWMNEAVLAGRSSAVLPGISSAAQRLPADGGAATSVACADVDQARERQGRVERAREASLARVRSLSPVSSPRRLRARSSSSSNNNRSSSRSPVRSPGRSENSPVSPIRGAVANLFRI